MCKATNMYKEYFLYFEKKLGNIPSMEKMSVMSGTIKTLAEKPAAAEWFSQMLILKSDQGYWFVCDRGEMSTNF